MTCVSSVESLAGESGSGLAPCAPSLCVAYDPAHARVMDTKLFSDCAHRTTATHERINNRPVAIRLVAVYAILLVRSLARHIATLHHRYFAHVNRGAGDMPLRL